MSEGLSQTARSGFVITDHLAVKIWAEMAALGKPTIGSPTVAQIRAALERALAGEAG